MTYRVRTQTATGDMTFGRGSGNFLKDSPAAVAQRAKTRLNLWEGDWYLDLADGLPQFQQILGFKNIALAQALIRERIANTPFLINITDFSVIWNNQERTLTVLGKASTIFGALVFNFPLTPQLARTVQVGEPPFAFGVGDSGLIVD